MRQMSLISGNSIFIGFRKFTGCQRDPQDRGVTLCPSNHHMVDKPFDQDNMQSFS